LEKTQAALLRRIADRTCVVGVIGLGYVGLPLLVELGNAGFQAVGIDVNPSVVADLNRGRSHIRDVPSDAVATLVERGLVRATTAFERLAECDVVVICVPTPLSKLKDPDLSYVTTAARTARASLRPGQLVILESTTYPGTTRDVVLPILQEAGLTVGVDYFLCFSPERVDPANAVWNIKNTPKLLGGVTDACAAAGEAFYGSFVERVVRVSSVEAAELAKVYENTFRMVNIALANELALVCARLGLDPWEVIDAASTKPFGFMRFTPGPGLGGHCIPLDPHYLSWKMETLDFKTRLIELASEINAQMPAVVVNLVGDALNDAGLPVRGSRVLILGVAFKPNVNDYRESPALEIIRLLHAKGARVEYHDPMCPILDDERLAHLPTAPLRSVDLTEQALVEADAVVVVTDHATIDFDLVADRARLVIDSRGAMRNRPTRGRVVGLSGLASEAEDAASAHSELALPAAV
jgi:UDP-N-acetyl-D-glucosamine dehydrogenase